MTHFIASDSGSECADSVPRGANAYAASDLDPLAYGNANVFIPSLKRCDRYQLTMNGTVGYLDSRPCTGSHGAVTT